MHRIIDERKLVTRILSGHERALRLFYRHFYRSLSTYIGKKVGNPKDVEEILQDTYLGAIEGFRDFAFKCSLFTFLCSIANHKIIDFYRRKKIKDVVFSKITRIEPLLSTLIGPEDTFNRHLLTFKIKRTFRVLAPRYSRILTLKYIEGYSVSEIAGLLSLSFKSVESRLFRARKAFIEAFNL